MLKNVTQCVIGAMFHPVNIIVVDFKFGRVNGRSDVKTFFLAALKRFCCIVLNKRSCLNKRNPRSFWQPTPKFWRRTKQKQVKMDGNEQKKGIKNICYVPGAPWLYQGVCLRAGSIYSVPYGIQCEEGCFLLGSKSGWKLVLEEPNFASWELPQALDLRN